MDEKLKLRHILGYSSVNFLGSGAQGLMSAWLMYFYTTLCGISPVKAGLIFTAARLIDAFGNPIVGFISDNFGKTKLGIRFGRRKFFMLVGIIVLVIVFPILWTTGHSFAFYFVINLIYEISYTLIFVPITTLPAEMTQNAAEKAKLSGGKQYCGTISSVITGFITAKLFTMYGNNSASAFWYIGLSYGIITAVALVFCYFNVYERDPKTIVYEDSAGSVVQVFKKLGVDVASSMRNKSFRLHSAMWFIDCIFKQISGGVFTYFAIFVVMATKVNVAWINTASSVVSCVALFFFILAAYKIGGPKTYIIGSLITYVSLGGFMVLVLMGKSSMTIMLLTVFALINIVGKTGVDYPPIYQMAFIPDIDEAITGKRREGIYNGVNSLFGKVAAAIEAAVLGIVLSAVGFKSGKNVHIQPHSAIVGIWVITIIVPFVLLLIGCISAMYFKLTKENHKILVAEVERVKNGGSKADVTPEAREAIEVLTGWKYEQCFGNNDVGYSNKTHGKGQATGA